MKLVSSTLSNSIHHATRRPAILGRITGSVYLEFTNRRLAYGIGDASSTALFSEEGLVVVAAINFDWRAYDTLGEATILLTAATGVKLLMRRYIQRRRETGIA